MEICIDFDGTCVTHEFPKVGRDIGAVPVLQQLVASGHKLILFTMRSNVTDTKSKDVDILNIPGNYLNDAVDWFIRNGIPLYGINTNPTQKEWTNSPKAYGQLYIDDAALGIPLINAGNVFVNSYVDWIAVRKLLVEKGLIK